MNVSLSVIGVVLTVLIWSFVDKEWYRTKLRCIVVWAIWRAHRPHVGDFWIEVHDSACHSIYKDVWGDDLPCTCRSVWHFDADAHQRALVQWRTSRMIRSRR